MFDNSIWAYEKLWIQSNTTKTELLLFGLQLKQLDMNDFIDLNEKKNTFCDL